MSESIESSAQFRQMLERIEEAIRSNHGLSVQCKDIEDFWLYFKGNPEGRDLLKEQGYDYSPSSKGWIVFRTELDQYKPDLRKPKETIELPVPKHVAEAEARKRISQQYR